MAYDDKLAGRVRRVLAGRRDVEEKKMFGGIAFMIRGHMSCGLIGSTLMVRVEEDEQAALLGQPHVRPMDFTGRPLKGFLYVDPPAVASGPGLKKWVARGIAFAENRPRKAKKRKTARVRR
jgi:TfoX/Sxy family transcriptional regulator of competence genes